MSVPRRYRRWALAHALLVIIFCATSTLQAQQDPQPGRDPGSAAERALAEQTGVDPQLEHSQDCLNGYTSTMCTGENTKFLGAFDFVCLIGIPVVFVVIVPFLLGASRARPAWWWITDHRKRWVFPTLAGAAVVVAAVLTVPFIPQMSPVRPESGLLKTLGVDPAYIDSCSPCRTRVSNRSPFFNLLPSGMPTQGLAPEFPWALGGSVIAAFGVWSGAYWVVFILIRYRKGLSSDR